MNKNAKLRRALVNNNDEFYTRYEDIVKELKYYTKHFYNDVIYCAADDQDSNFVRYFRDHFDFYDLAKVVRNSLFNAEFTIYYKESGSMEGAPFEYPFFNGDIVGPNTEKQLQESIVVTNPPFSILRSKILPHFDKLNVRFLIVVPMHIFDKDLVVQNIKNGKWHAGYNIIRKFDTPTGEAIAGSTWLTSLPLPLKPFLDLKPIEQTKCKEFDNYVPNLLHVPAIKDIPCCSGKLLAVPATFLRHYNAEQFEIVGGANVVKNLHLRIDGKRVFTRILVKWKGGGCGH